MGENIVRRILLVLTLGFAALVYLPGYLGYRGSVYCFRLFNAIGPSEDERAPLRNRIQWSTHPSPWELIELDHAQYVEKYHELCRLSDEIDRLDAQRNDAVRSCKEVKDKNNAIPLEGWPSSDRATLDQSTNEVVNSKMRLRSAQAAYDAKMKGTQSVFSDFDWLPDVETRVLRRSSTEAR